MGNLSLKDLSEDGVECVGGAESDSETWYRGHGWWGIVRYAGFASIP